MFKTEINADGTFRYVEVSENHMKRLVLEYVGEDDLYDMDKYEGYFYIDAEGSPVFRAELKS